MQKSLLWILPMLSACVTSGDLAEVSASLEHLERVIEEEQPKSDEIEKAIVEAREQIEQVADRVEARTERAIDEVSGAVDAVSPGEAGGIAGAISVIVAALLGAYRSITRRRDLERLERQVIAAAKREAPTDAGVGGA